MIRPAVFAPFDRISAGMSTRHGGVSQLPYGSLNLDHRGPDDEALRSENRRRFCTSMGFQTRQLVRALQVHGTAILVATTGCFEDGYDAFITDKPGLLLAVSVADCTPILIYDAKNHAVGAVHAGWKGTVGRLVELTLKSMNHHYGTLGADCYAYIGACIDECSFEVDAEVADQFDVAFKRWDAERQKFMVDLKKSNAAQLFDFGMPKNQVEISPLSTVLDHKDFYSYRYENGVTGRMLAGIGIF